MKNDLVFVKNKEMFTSSMTIAEKIEISHRDVLRLIKNLITDLSAQKCAVRFPEKFIEKTIINSRGRKYICYDLNKSAFSLLMMRLHSKRAIEWQRRFNDAFYGMEQSLLNQQNASWSETREIGKEVRLQLTDTIKEFVDYSEKQGNTKAKWYYSTITKMTYKGLELIDNNKSTPVRDMLAVIDIGHLMTAENLVQTVMAEEMKKNTDYHDIFQICKNKIVELHDLVVFKPQLKKVEKRS